ncbi:GTP cyclohydrolase II [Novilysobacter defluvii]|uniref:GTP cyclohydrolase-2 n=1 Tax=Lysobacter defluvii IMMIB APB-9 = DSM 18482 TaxID=1385515 RepID=A0A0A0M8A3_9GAMM|nr:GTP cyclohydrolase II [Lysobacter defluvii]KGO98429.1 GTP cyclohydrolase [Lysobacter defluvii IMMIB APB-9 = DSM 18482]
MPDPKPAPDTARNVAATTLAHQELGGEVRVAGEGSPAEWVRLVDSCDLPTRWGAFRLHGFVDLRNGQEHVALALGDLAGSGPVLARVHSECLTGDAFGSRRCDCGAQLEAAMERIAAEGRGVILYMRQEGRGIGLLNKIRAYHLQDDGADTVQANQALGFAPDLRSYELVAPMLARLGVQAVRLMTNNPRKVDALQAAGVPVAERLPIRVGRNPANQGYLDTKRSKLGHLLDPDAG